MNRRYIIVGVLAATLAAVARGQQLSVDQRLEQLEQEIKILKRQRELAQEAAVEKKTPILQADEKGFGFKSADGSFAIRLGGQIKADGGFYLNDDAQKFTDTFTISSARPIITGTVFKSFDFTLSADFGGSSPSLTDAFVEWKYWPALKIRAGRYKQPFGLERLQSDVNNSFTSLGLPSQLVPARDVALQVGGDLLDGVFNYVVSAGNGVSDGGSANGDTTDDKELTGRLWVSPFKKTDINALQGLSVGVAVSYGLQKGQTNAANLASYKTAGGNTFFSYQSGSTNAVFASGDRLRVGPQFLYYYGRLGLLGEYVVSSQEVTRPSPGHTDTLRNSAWQLVGSFALTDDEPSYKGLGPKKPFSLQNGTWGALELVARVGQFEVDSDAFSSNKASWFADPTTQASRATAWGVGLNWYLNKNVRWFLDYDHTTFDGGAGKVTGSTVTALKHRASEDFLSTRFQLAF